MQTQGKGAVAEVWVEVEWHEEQELESAGRDAGTMTVQRQGWVQLHAPGGQGEDYLRPVLS